MAYIIFKQAVTMLLLMAVGFYLTKNGTIDEEFSKKLGRVLLDVIVPCLALNGFLAPPEGATVSDLWMALGLSAVLLLVSTIIGFLVYGRRKPIEDFAAAFMNVGFIGVPIVTAVFGPSAMFYVAST
ncbi:MAG: AEC family transporter, partial [Atopobiaceae bacterium]|nr:AEC family transporter [Atopobiaceae bacterium]